MTTEDRFREGLANWRAVLASLGEGDVEARATAFDEAAKDAAGYVAGGLPMATAIDALYEMAQAHGLVAHLGEDALQTRIAAAFAGVPRPPLPATPPNGPGTATKPNGKKHTAAVVALDEWDAGDEPGAIAPREWLLGNQFCRGFISSIVAAGGVGKSALRLLQFVSMALGRPLCGQHVFARCRVLLISFEDDRAELQRRITAILKHFNIARSELHGWLFCATPRAKIAELKDRKRIIGPLENQIRDAIIRRQPDVVSLDPYIKLHGLSENDSGDMDFVCNLLAQLAISLNVAVDSPHHVHKGIVTPGDADSGRGSSGIRDAGRLIYTLAPMSEADAKMFPNVKPDERTSYIRLDAAKVNIAAKSAHPVWFRLVSVPIGNATEKYPAGDTVQVAEPWTPDTIWQGVSQQQIDQILKLIDAGMGNGVYYSAAPSAKERAAWPVVLQFLPDRNETQARSMIASWVRNGVLTIFPYRNESIRKDEQGLRVNSTARPEATAQ
jgi:hypothetical protein